MNSSGHQYNQAYYDMLEQRKRARRKNVFIPMGIFVLMGVLTIISIKSYEAKAAKIVDASIMRDLAEKKSGPSIIIELASAEQPNNLAPETIPIEAKETYPSETPTIDQEADKPKAPSVYLAFGAKTGESALIEMVNQLKYVFYVATEKTELSLSKSAYLDSEAGFAKLGKDAAKYVSKLMRDNHISNPRKLAIGTILQIPLDPTKPDSLKVNYTVQKGDNPWKIALEKWGGNPDATNLQIVLSVGPNTTDP